MMPTIELKAARRAKSAMVKVARAIAPRRQRLPAVPSELLRRIAADVKRVTAAGMHIDMQRWFAMTNYDQPQPDNCSVCLAGATMLGSGRYRALVDDVHVIGTAGATALCVPICEYDTFDTYGEADRELIDAVNMLRQGSVYGLLGWCGIAPGAALRADNAIPRSLQLHYLGKVADSRVPVLCQKLEQLADYLEKQGY